MLAVKYLCSQHQMSHFKCAINKQGLLSRNAKDDR